MHWLFLSLFFVCFLPFSFRFVFFDSIFIALPAMNVLCKEVYWFSLMCSKKHLLIRLWQIFSFNLSCSTKCKKHWIQKVTILSQSNALNTNGGLFLFLRKKANAFAIPPFSLSLSHSFSVVNTFFHRINAMLNKVVRSIQETERKMCIFYRKMFALVLYSELVIGWKQIKEEMNKQKGMNPKK